jgi:hypothetical protein
VKSATPVTSPAAQTPSAAQRRSSVRTPSRSTVTPRAARSSASTFGLAFDRLLALQFEPVGGVASPGHASRSGAEAQLDPLFAEGVGEDVGALRIHARQEVPAVLDENDL